MARELAMTTLSSAVGNHSTLCWGVDWATEDMAKEPPATTGREGTHCNRVTSAVKLKIGNDARVEDAKDMPKLLAMESINMAPLSLCDAPSATFIDQHRENQAFVQLKAPLLLMR